MIYKLKLTPKGKEICATAFDQPTELSNPKRSTKSNMHNSNLNSMIWN